MADWLSLRGIPFKEAHEITGTLVQACEAAGIGLEEASPAFLLAVDTRLSEGVRQALTLDAALAIRSGWNGTAPAQVCAQIERFKQQLGAQQQWALDYTGPRG